MEQSGAIDALIPGALRRRGHQFHGNYIDGGSPVHMGDVYNINHHDGPSGRLCCRRLPRMYHKAEICLTKR